MSLVLGHFLHIVQKQFMEVLVGQDHKAISQSMTLL